MNVITDNHPLTTNECPTCEGPILPRIIQAFIELRDDLALDSRGKAWAAGFDLQDMSRDEILNELTALRTWMGLRQLMAVFEPRIPMKRTAESMLEARIEMLQAELSSRYRERPAERPKTPSKYPKVRIYD